MEHLLTSMNVKDLLNTRLINEIQLTKNSHRSEISINISKDGKLILVSVTNGCATKGAVYVLSKVDDFYIIEGKLDPDDENIGGNYGCNTAIYQNDKGYTVAVSDTSYIGSDDKTEVGAVFLFQYIPTRKWECIKVITILDDTNEFKYIHVGKNIAFLSTGSLVVVADVNKGSLTCDYSQLFLYEIDDDNENVDFKQFIKYTIAEDNTIRISNVIKVVNDIIYIVVTDKRGDRFKSELWYCDANRYGLKLKHLVSYTYDDVYTHIVDFHIYDNKLLVAVLDISGLSTPSLVFNLYKLEKEKELKAYSLSNAFLSLNPVRKDSVYDTEKELSKPTNNLSKDSRLSLDFRNDEIFISFLTTDNNNYNNVLIKYNIQDGLQNITNDIYEELYRKELNSSDNNRRSLVYPKICNKLKVIDSNIFFIDREKCDIEQKSIYHLKCI